MDDESGEFMEEAELVSVQHQPVAELLCPIVQY